MSAAGTRAVELVRRAGVAHRVHTHGPPERHGLDREARPAYGRDAAEALGVAPERIFKTLVATLDGGLVLAVVPVNRELDPKRLAESLGGRRADLAEPAVAARATGYVIGGISPLGSRRPLPVVVDDTSSEQATIFVSAGRRGLQLELAPADLVRLTGAIVAPISRSP